MAGMVAYKLPPRRLRAPARYRLHCVRWPGTLHVLFVYGELRFSGM